jgi:hypothetical protein
MDKKLIKRGYNFSQEMIKEWENFHKPSKDFSPSAAGAFLVWMILPPDIREMARKAAYEPNIKKSLSFIKKELAESLHKKSINRWIAGLSYEQYEALMSNVNEIEIEIEKESEPEPEKEEESEYTKKGRAIVQRAAKRVKKDRQKRSKGTHERSQD